MTDQTTFTSREVCFLKQNSQTDIQALSGPDTYLSDLLFSPDRGVSGFDGRLSGIDIRDNPCICAVLKVSLPADEERIDRIGSVFENTFSSLLDHQRGVWEQITDTAFALAFFDIQTCRKGAELIGLLRKRLADCLETGVTAGTCCYPFHSFSLEETLGNAVKAADHAAFFGPDGMAEFDSVSLNICGDRLYQTGKKQLAALEYQAGLELDPTNVNLLNSLGVCYGVLNRLEDAKQTFKKALAINPEEPMVLYNMGLVHSINQSGKRAIAYLKKAHTVAPDLFEAVLLLGSLLLKDGKPDPALSHLEQAIALNPGAGVAHRLAGLIYLDSDRLDKAFESFTRAIKLNPEDAESLSGAAKVLDLQDRNLSIAFTFARKSLDIEPDNELYQKRFADIQSKINPESRQASGY